MPKLLQTLSALLRKLLINFGLVSKTRWLKTFYRGNFTLWLPWEPVFLYLGDVFDLPVAQRVEPRFLVFSPVELHYGIVKGWNWTQFPVQLRNCYWLSDSVPKALLQCSLPEHQTLSLLFTLKTADIEKTFVRLTNQKTEKRLNDVVKPQSSQFVCFAFFLVNHFHLSSAQSAIRYSSFVLFVCFRFCVVRKSLFICRPYTSMQVAMRRRYCASL